MYWRPSRVMTMRESSQRHKHAARSKSFPPIYRFRGFRSSPTRRDLEIRDVTNIFPPSTGWISRTSRPKSKRHDAHSARTLRRHSKANKPKLSGGRGHATPTEIAVNSGPMRGEYNLEWIGLTGRRGHAEITERVCGTNRHGTSSHDRTIRGQIVLAQEPQFL